MPVLKHTPSQAGYAGASSGKPFKLMIIIYPFTSMFSRHHHDNMLDCSRACITTFEERYVIHFCHIDRWKIHQSKYIVLAGFDESLIKSGIDYLEQLHVVILAQPLLCCQSLEDYFPPPLPPFSQSVLPLIKNDGSALGEFNKPAYFTAFANGKSST